MNFIPSPPAPLPQGEGGNKPKWIIVFDWDGTLIESLPLKIRNAGRLFEETFGVPRAGIEAAYRVHSGIPRRQLLDRGVRFGPGRGPGPGA